MTIQPLPLSRYGRASSEPAPVNRMMAQFAADFRQDVDINLGVGYVNERTIPRAWVEEALHQVLADPQRYPLALNYGGPAGSANLIQSLRRFHRDCHADLTEDVLDRNRIIVGPNGATSLLESIAHVMAPGIVVTCDPVYYIYCHFLERMGYEICAVPEDENGVDTDRLEARIDQLGDRKREIRCFYVVTVSNPTCSILAGQRRRKLVQIAARLSRELKRQVPVFFDLAYENLIHDPTVPRPCSALPWDDLGIVYEIGTLSKILAPALRIGYLIGRDGPFLRALIQRTSDAGFSAPLVTQEIARYLLDHHVRRQLDEVNAGYRKKAEATRRWIQEQLGSHLAECRGGQAGFYFYLTFGQIETHERSPFFRFLSRTTGDPQIDGPPKKRNPRVLYIPGQFCVHASGELVERGRRQLRLSYGFEELPQIQRALAMMGQAASHAERAVGGGARPG